MIHLSNAPIFLAFLQKYFRFSKSKYHHGDFSNHFYIAGKCNCNQKDCGTVILKRRNSCKNKNIIEDLQLSAKGIFHVHDDLENGYFEVEAIYYNFPFKNEINKLFPKNGRLGKHRFSKKPTKKKINAQDKMQLKRYFNNKMSRYEELFYNGIGYRGIKSFKSFQHVR